MSKLILVHSLLLFLTYNLWGAAPVVVLGNERDEYEITNYLFLKDCHLNLKDKEVLNGFHDNQFQANTKSLHLTENNRCVYWIKFQLKNNSDQDKRWLLEFYDFKIDKLTLYEPLKNGAFKATIAGDQLPAGNKPFFHKNIEFPIHLNPIENKNYYIRLETSEVVSLTFLARSYNHFLKYALQEYIILGLYYGIITIIIILNLFLFFTSKDPVYLYYVGYVFSIAMFSLMVVDGLGFQFFWPNNPSMNNYSISFASLCLVVSALWYCRSFLLLRINFPFLNKIILSYIGIRISIFLLDLAFHFYDHWNPLYDGVGLFLAYCAGIYCLIKGYTPARYYVVAFTFVFCGYLIFALSNRGIISSNFITVYALNYAVAIELVLLSHALAERIEAFKKEKEKALEEKMNQLMENQKLQKNIISQLRENEILKDKVNRELEEKVRERTADLLLAQTQIEEMNRLLHADNKILESNVKKLYKDRIMQKVVTFEEFQNIYPDDKACYEFLENLKWSEGFSCMQCNNVKYARGNMPYSRRCSKCGLIESVTAGTIFYRLKFSVVKAFYMVFLVSTNQRITSEELSKTISLRKQTCWAFKKKIMERIGKSPKRKNHDDSWSHLIMDVEAVKIKE